MKWNNISISKSELEKKQQEYMHMAMEMAKRAQKDTEPEKPLPDNKVNNTVIINQENNITFQPQTAEGNTPVQQPIEIAVVSDEKNNNTVTADNNEINAEISNQSASGESEINTEENIEEITEEVSEEISGTSEEMSEEENEDIPVFENDTENETDSYDEIESETAALPQAEPAEASPDTEIPDSSGFAADTIDPEAGLFENIFMSEEEAEAQLEKLAAAMEKKGISERSAPDFQSYINSHNKAYGAGSQSGRSAQPKQPQQRGGAE